MILLWNNFNINIFAFDDLCDKFLLNVTKIDQFFEENIWYSISRKFCSITSLKSSSLWPVFSKIIFSKTYSLRYVKKILFNKVIEKFWYVTSFFQNNVFSKLFGILCQENFVQYSQNIFNLWPAFIKKNSLRSSSSLKKLMIWFSSLPLEFVWIFLIFMYSSVFSSKANLIQFAA